MKEKFWKAALILALCTAFFAGAHAVTLAELFGLEEGEEAIEPVVTPSPEEDPFAMARVAMEAPVVLTEPAATPISVPVLPDPEEMTTVGTDEQKAPVDEMQIPNGEIEDDGVIRVLLQSLKNPASLTLTLDGVYTVEHDAGFRFRRGTQLSLTNVGERIYMTVGGLTLDMGGALTLTRQAAEEKNAIYIMETGRDAYYPGDLAIRAENGGLRCILSVNMEDYLKGVIAYEMSDSWPVEALKCQAVAARTYALQRKFSAGSRDYDVTDTTSDQVFKGVDSSYTNVAEAVRATEGVVGLDARGRAATCWYTASNGGRIARPEEVWVGADACAYIESKDDPYDLENSRSMVKSLAFSADVHESAALKRMLQAALEEKYADEDAIELDEVMSVEAVEDEPEGSRMYRKLRFTVTATASAEVPQADSAVSMTEKERRALDALLIVDLSVYDQIKRELDLGINTQDYDMCTAARVDDQFVIEMRRFGHGVGMSQRGAQCMAGTYGKQWTEIFGFYYPGLTLQKLSWNTPELEALEEMTTLFGAARPEPTPGATAAPLPALKAGEYYARISLGSDGSMMNLRQSPTTQSEVITQLADGQRLIVEREDADENGWVPVHTAEYSGYAKLDYLKRE